MFPGSDPSCPSHWKQCGAVAKIIAGCPVPKEQISHYVSSVSQQVGLHLWLELGDGVGRWLVIMLVFHNRC